MWNLVILFFLLIFLYISLKKACNKSFIKTKNNYERIKSEHERSLHENARLKQETSALEKKAEEIIALYDITKDICKSLDEEKVFTFFKERINRYIKISDCKFIKETADILKDNLYTVVPLEINKKPLGYLAVSGLKEEEKEKFHILTQQFLLGIKRALLYRKVQELAITDNLTGVFSRRFYMERCNEEIARSKKFNLKFSFLMIDMDHFKEYNDRYGHLVGDAILKEVSKTIKENMRQIDLIGRYGGEEFSIVLIETDIDAAKFAAERIRKSVEDKYIKVYDENLKVTISIGISTFPEDAKNIEVLIDKADRALYRAKQAGRNRIFTSSPK